MRAVHRPTAMHHRKKMTIRADLNSLPTSLKIFDENLFGLNCNEKNKKCHSNVKNVNEIVILAIVKMYKNLCEIIKLTSRHVETNVLGSNAAAIR